MIMEEPDYVTTTKRGKPNIIHQGYGYVKDKDGTANVAYWRCESKQELECKEQLKTDGMQVTAIVGDHSHRQTWLKRK